jgi:flagellar motility protein MotE (MotC chaperone)
MKPKDAAAIFERLDMDIQQQVALRMSDRKMAALLAEMDTDVAKTLTTRLATRNPLPNVEALGQETAAQ